jgi:hypothetical protein
MSRCGACQQLRREKLLVNLLRRQIEQVLRLCQTRSSCNPTHGVGGLFTLRLHGSGASLDLAKREEASPFVVGRVRTIHPLPWVGLQEDRVLTQSLCWWDLGSRLLGFFSTLLYQLQFSTQA